MSTVPPRPHPGDIYIATDSERVEPTSLFDRLLQALYLRPERPTHYHQHEFRLVEEVRRDVVFYRNHKHRLHAAWLTEWLDWQLLATQVCTKGVLIESFNEDDLKSLLDVTELPFDLSAYQENTNE